MRIREAVAAGRWYTAHADRCAERIDAMLAEAPRLTVADTHVYGGLAPACRWPGHGNHGAGVFTVFRERTDTTTVVVFGDGREVRSDHAVLFASGCWETPVGNLEVDSRLADRILGHTNLILDDPYAHENELAIEVLLPFVRRVFQAVRIVPILVPSVEIAHETGEAVARTLRAYRYRCLVLGAIWPKRCVLDQPWDGDFPLTDEAAKLAAKVPWGGSAAAVAAMATVFALGARRGMMIPAEFSAAKQGAVGCGEASDIETYPACVFV